GQRLPTAHDFLTSAFPFSTRYRLRARTSSTAPVRCKVYASWHSNCPPGAGLMFVDEVQVTVKAGRGGDGSCSFRREMFVPRGGPDGGDGGNGGDVIFTASHRLTTLLDLRYQRHYEAEDGRAGSGSNCTGRRGKSVDVIVPVGTVIYDDATGEILA